MESLFIVALVALLAGPVLAIISLIQISNLKMRLASINSDLARLAAGGVQPAAAEAAAVTESADEAPVKSAGWGGIGSPPAPEKGPQDAGAEPIPEPASEKPAAPVRDMEKALASRWFVWIGGVAVALGGLLFVKYAHDNGLIPPFLRVIIGLVFGAALIGAGEWLRTRHIDLAKSYVPAALSAAGLAIAFGVIYAAYALYNILSPGVCFPLLVALGLGALWLSNRQGPLIAALGLIGSYAAPALVPSENPSAFGFFAYLLVLVVACHYQLRKQPWWWLGYAALVGATAWAVLWLQGALFAMDHILPAGVFALLMGTAATVIPVGRGIFAAEMGSFVEPAKTAQPMRLAIAGMAGAAVVLLALVWQAQHATLALLLFALGMLAISAFGWLRDGLVAAPLAAAVLSLLILLAWPDVGFHELAMDDRGFWVTIPGKIAPFHFRNAMFVALLAFGALGLAGVFKRQETRPWAAMATGAPVLFLFGAWARADSTLAESSWAVVAVASALVLAVSARQVWNLSDRTAPNHTVEILLGGVALLVLFALDRLFSDVALTLAIALLATGFAYATKIFTLPRVAAIAAALAGFAALRLFVGREFWGEHQGVLFGPHWVLYGYGLPAVLFWLASRWLIGEGFARYRAAFEGVALGLAISLVSAELRVLIAGGLTTERLSLLELASHSLAWLGAAYGLANRQTLFSSFISLWGARALLAASSVALLLALTARNPVFTGDTLEGGKVFNSLWLAYLAPVPLLAVMARKLEGLGLARFRTSVGIFALVLLIAFVTLQIKRFFQDETLAVMFESDAESYAVSAAWIFTAIAIFVGGIGLNRQSIRLGGLAILVCSILKVFAIDLFELGGLWRIASIIGLGLCLIGVGWLYARFVQRPNTAAVTL